MFMYVVHFLVGWKITLPAAPGAIPVELDTSDSLLSPVYYT